MYMLFFLKQVNLCFLRLDNFFSFLKKQTGVDDLLLKKLKKKWDAEKKIKKIFLNTFFLLVFEDVVLLKVKEDSEKFFLSKEYRLEEQEICEIIWGEKKHLVIVSEEQWNFFLKGKKITSTDNLQQALILLKDEESIQEVLNNYFFD